MNIKASVAVAVLAVSTVGVSACSSSTSKSAGGTTPTTVVGSTSSTTSSTTASAPATSASSTASSSAPSTAATSSSGTTSQPQVGTDVPVSAMLSPENLAASPRGVWTTSGSQTSPASQIIDPDNCDPVPRPQFVDPGYPRNSAWVMNRSQTFGAADSASVSESVITYKSADAASQDFAKHKSWLGKCGTGFQWTDRPSKYVVSNAQLNGMTNGYAIRVAMYAPGEPASSAGSQGYVYMAVILRGNSLTVLNVSDSGSDSSKPQDPGPSAIQHDVQAAAGKLATAFGH